MKIASAAVFLFSFLLSPTMQKLLNLLSLSLCILFLLLSLCYLLLIFFFFLSLVAAINALFISLGYPPLRGWILVGGDPCGEKWQGVECVFSNITAMYVNSIHHLLANFIFLSVNNATIICFCHRQLSGLNLGGELGTSLDQFESIISM